MSVPFIDSIGFGTWDSPAIERAHHRARQIHQSSPPSSRELANQELTIPRARTTILDDSEQYLRAREAEAMCDHVWIFEARDAEHAASPATRKDS
jgi:hypothetical protein